MAAWPQKRRRRVLRRHELSVCAVADTQAAAATSSSGARTRVSTQRCSGRKIRFGAPAGVAEQGHCWRSAWRATFVKLVAGCRRTIGVRVAAASFSQPPSSSCVSQAGWPRDESAERSKQSRARFKFKILNSNSAAVRTSNSSNVDVNRRLPQTTASQA